MSSNIYYLGKDISRIISEHDNFSGADTLKEHDLHKEVITQLKKLVTEIEFFIYKGDESPFYWGPE